jgi:RNA polymerase sigma factor (sigma-70 family)
MTEEELNVLYVAIAKLPPQRRNVLVLRVFYEYSTRQISESLNMPLRRVHHDLARALEAVHAARAMFEVDRGSHSPI